MTLTPSTIGSLTITPAGINGQQAGSTLYVGAPSGSDDTTVIQAAIDVVAALGGGTVMLTRGTYIAHGLTFPVNVKVALQGGGLGTSGNIFVTRITRNTDSPIIDATGTGTGAAQRILPELRDLELYGGGASYTSDIVHIQRASHFYAEGVRFQNGAVGGGAHFTQLWDSAFHRCIFERMGNGTTAPATLFDSYTGDGATGDCATVQFSDCIWQSNFGTDLKLSGSVADAAPANDMEFANSKFEGNGAGTVGSPDTTYPYIDLDYAQNCTFTNTRLSMPTGRGSLFLQQVGTSAGPRDNKFVNTVMDVAGTNNPTRYIDHSVGGLMFVGLSWPGTAPSTEYVRIQSGVSAGRHRIVGLTHNASAPYSGFITDSRTVNERISKGFISQATRVSGSATAATVGNGTVFDYSATVDTSDTFEIVIPRDADPNGQIRLRLLWTSDVGDNTKNVYWRASMIARQTVGTDMSASATTYDEIVSAPGTASQLAITEWTTGPACLPGASLSIIITRRGTNVSDTHTAGKARRVALEVTYDKRI